MKYFLDTNIIAYFMKGKFPGLKEHFETADQASIFIPSIVLAEIEYGARKSHNYEKTKALYNEFLEKFEVVDFSVNEAITYGMVRSQLESLGTPIGPNDMIIAATALANDAVVVTHNTKEFFRVEGLKVEDWTE